MKPLLFLLFLFSAIPAVSQQFVVANERENIVYCGIDNPLSVLVTSYPCQSVVLTTNNGKIIKAECGRFIYQPANQGVSKIKVWVKDSKKLKKIGEALYQAHQLPSPVAMVGSYIGGKIPAKVFIAMGGIRALLVCCGFDAPVRVDSFTITLIRNKKPVFWLDNIGPRFTDEVMNSLQDLITGDTIFITAIKVEMPDGEMEEVSPLKFTITD